MNLEDKIIHFLKNELKNNVDSSHDLGHLKRVANNCKIICKDDGGDYDVLIISSYFHDIVSLPKNSPERHKSSEFAAKKTISIVKDYFKEVPVSKYGIIEEAIVSHSYSANIKPVSIEAKILQDSDRIDALGAVGLARVFYIAGKLNQKLFDLDDPFATHRELDDKVYALDHFYTKLLKLPITMNTKKGKEIAEVQSDFLLAYIEKLKKEIEIT
ncbi:conserved hypothetical protein [Xenorhabdus nematophila str. Anatoliense]|nr:conserved hypothetical protein [Xenorhabdus nematophila str. Anatoliense]CEE95573.1 conserved hypothetical protein [Xenorhabdus nematophila str. Anatoliense]